MGIVIESGRNTTIEGDVIQQTNEAGNQIKDRLYETLLTDLQALVERVEADPLTASAAIVDEGENIFDMMEAMIPDMVEVTLTTLASPLAGIGLVARKIGQKVRLMKKEKNDA